MTPDPWDGYFENTATATSKRPIDAEVQKSLTFVQRHDEKLQSDLESCSLYGDCGTFSRPIRIALDPTERVAVLDILTPDETNESLQKAVVVFVFLCDEVHELKEIAEEKFYAPLIMFGRPPVDESVIELPGQRENMIGTFLPVLIEISHFLTRCKSVCVSLVQQLSAVLSERDAFHNEDLSQNSKPALNTNALLSTHLFSVFTSIGDLLSVLLLFDYVIRNNEHLKEFWFEYKKLIETVKTDLNGYQTNFAEILKIEKALLFVDASLMKGECFSSCIDQDFEFCAGSETEFLSVRSNELLLSEFLLTIQTSITNATIAIGSESELFERKSIPSYYCLYALYRTLLPRNVPPEGKVLSLLWKTQKRLPSIVLYQNIVWNAGDFLHAYAPKINEKTIQENNTQTEKMFLQEFDDNLRRESAMVTSQCSMWFILVASKLSDSLRYEKNPTLSLNLRGSVLLKGLALANRAVHLVQTFLVLHSAHCIPIGKSHLLDICHLLESVAAIESTYVRAEPIVREYHIHTTRQLYHSIFETVQVLKLKSNSLRSPSGWKSDSKELLNFYSSLSMIETIVLSSDSLSFSKQSVILIVSEIIHGFASSSVLSSSMKSVLSKESGNLTGLIYLLNATVDLPKAYKRVLNTSFLYHHIDLLPSIVSSLYTKSTGACRLPYIISSFVNGARLLSTGVYACPVGFDSDYKNENESKQEHEHESIRNNKARTVYLHLFRDFIVRTLRVCVVQPLGVEVETSLRIATHVKHLPHMASTDPRAGVLGPLRKFLDLPPIQIVDVSMDVKKEVARYLNYNFYNLTSVSVTDSQSYTEMRNLAKNQLGLDLMNSYLPMGSLCQGLDLLQIMRNLDGFVSQYSYNMNMQQFTEFKPSPTASTKHLNTLSIKSIMASIRQHGLGVIDTTVNFTYQFLSHHFHTFSQLLYDDFLQSRLAKDERWYAQHKNEAGVGNMYPYDRSLKLVKDMKRGGLNSAGASYLDQIRIIVTEIGNALGYVRMVHSASLGHSASAAKYLPELEPANRISFEKSAAAVSDAECHNLGPETIRAGRNLDAAINSLVSNFHHENDYFKVLVETFQSVLQSANQDHLRTFYVLVPALCISWTEAAIMAKDNMMKTTRGSTSTVPKEIYYSDDGFAMGVAYILAILKQTKKNSSLHWSESVLKKLSGDETAHQIHVAIRNEKEIARRKLDKEEERNLASMSFSKAAKYLFGSSTSTSSPASTSTSSAPAADVTIDSEKERRKEEKSRRKYSRQLNEAGKDEEYDDQADASMILQGSKRISAMKRETEQLFFSLCGARIFFKRADVDI